MLTKLLEWFRHVLQPCNYGCHQWTMPGGWCEDCGICDRMFGEHNHCGEVCEYYKQANGMQ